MTSKEAKYILNEYRNRNYNSANKDEVELANAINIILPKYVKQEKLQDLYKEYFNLRTLPIIFNTVFYRLQEIEKQIKELENENKGGKRK